MQIKQGNFCPLLQKECIGLQCAWITQIRGNDPQTGKEIDEWDCAVKWMPTLLIENSNQQRHTSAAVESFRNNTVELFSPVLPHKEQTKPLLITKNETDFSS